MKFRAILLSFLATALLCSCSSFSQWLLQHELNDKKEESVNKARPHPVGVTYDLIASDSPSKQISVFYNGEGLARVLFKGSSQTKKTIIDYQKQEVVNKDFEKDLLETTKLDPYEFPAVLNAENAGARKASCIGRGWFKNFPYHRWLFKDENSEWEVWTDDNDAFPVYFRSVRNGQVRSWLMQSSWIDGSTYDRPTFFSLEPDPLPKPESEQSELEQPRASSEANHHPKRSKHRHR